MNLEQLLVENFKLNLYEARVYLALTKGQMTPRQISAESQVPLPRIYDTLRSLEAKGFVEERGEKFSAISPQAALEARKAQFATAFAKEQDQRARWAEELVKKLGPAMRSAPPDTQDVILLRGINAISSKFREVISASKDIMLVAQKSLGAKEFFRPYLKGRSTPVRILVPKHAALTEDDISFVAQSGFELREAENLFLDIMVADDVVMLGVPDPYSQEQFHSIAVLIISEPFARSVSRSLDSIWRTASQIKPRSK